jgi:hypothetical protein
MSRRGLPLVPGRQTSSQIGARPLTVSDRRGRLLEPHRLGRQVEFGYKVQVVDNDDEVVLDQCGGQLPRTPTSATPSSVAASSKPTTG